MELKDKVALITGCSTGVGMQTAVGLAQQGARVYATMRNTKKSGPLEEAAKRAGVSVAVLELDVQDEASVGAAVARVIKEAGTIDILVNNAGFGSVRTLEQATTAQINEIMDVNFHGAVRCIRAVLPIMRAKHSGHILSVSSVGGLVGQPLNEIYCAAKFALEGLIESMATYMQPSFGITLSLIEPAGIKTEFVNRVLGDLKADTSPLQDVYGPIFSNFLAQAAKRGAMDARAQTPEQVADVIVARLKDDSGGLRTLTSDFARAFVAEKVAGDPDGSKLQKRIRAEHLGIKE